ncbi:MAG TPA: acetylglutamate kinase [Acidobacteriota bacterium]|nr:acetylglutamate kinase [Acidobacteriota bacterium]
MRLTVKLGGSLLEESASRRALLGQVADLVRDGHEITLVHGGGRALSRRLSQLGIESHFVDGLRVTDAATLSVAVMVLAGEVNKMLVSEMGETGCRALGICGADAWLVRCERLSLTGARRDLEYVGKPVSVNSEFFNMVLKWGLVPVISSIALGWDFRLYNVNADQMASVCARGSGAQALVYLTDVPGIMGEGETVLRHARRTDIESLHARGILTGGMLPKTTSCLEALDSGIESVFIVPGKSPEILKGVVSGKNKEGTQIHGNKD